MRKRAGILYTYPVPKTSLVQRILIGYVGLVLLYLVPCTAVEVLVKGMIDAGVLRTIEDWEGDGKGKVGNESVFGNKENKKLARVKR